MRIVATSDLRYTPDRHYLFTELVDFITDQQPDVLIMAGNLGEPYENFEAALTLFDDLTCEKLILTGNRDLWNRVGPYTSQQLWEEMLPLAIHRHGCTWLEAHNAVYGRLGICGTIGWYDYSARDSSLAYDLEQYEEYKGFVNYDKQFIDWPFSDREFAATVNKQFKQRLDRLTGDQNIEHVMAVTHFPIFYEIIERDPSDAQWNFGTAFAFNLTLGRLIATRNKVRWVVSGHIRYGCKRRIQFGEHGIETVVLGHEGEHPDVLTYDIDT